MEKKKSVLSKQSLEGKIYTWKFLVLPVAMYLVFFVLPSIMSIVLSFTDWSVRKWDYDFIGFKNYHDIFCAVNGKYAKYIVRTLGFSLVSAFLKTALGLLLAVFLNRALKSKNILRALFYLPIIISPLILGIVFKSIFHPNGLLNSCLRTLGLDVLAQNWLTDKKFAMGSVTFVEVWRYIGFNMAIFLAGLQMIDRTYYEAAEIDGANSWVKFFKITVPSLMPAITSNTILNVMFGLKVFDIVFALTNGGPGDMTEVINTAVFKEYSRGRYGFSVALGVLLFIMTAVISGVIYMVLMKKEVEQ